jgi:hypothetical protein
MSNLIPAAEALAILRAAGVNAAKSPARGRCRTLCYLVGGQYVNLGRLRELAREALAAQAEPAPVVAEPEAVDRLGFATFNPETESLGEALPPDCYPPATRRPVLPGEPEPVAARVAEPGPVTLPGEDRAAVAATLPARFAGGGFAGRQPWDPGTPEARARVALQGERVATLWPIAQAVRGAGFDLPPAWWPDGPVMAGERTYGEALAALPLGAIAAAAAALAALPPVTTAQDRALRLCRGEAVGV